MDKAWSIRVSFLPKDSNKEKISVHFAHNKLQLSTTRPPLPRGTTGKPDIEQVLNFLFL